MTEFHFLRPLWFLVLIPLLAFFWLLWRQQSPLKAWAQVCDHHLLQHLLQSKGGKKRSWALFFLSMSAFCMVMSLGGPTWSRLPVPTFKSVQPRVVVLDLSDSMLIKDLMPDRLTRAKFKLHDLLKHREVGQLGLIVYTGEPFIVSPLTDDAQTIEALLSTLSPKIMPVTGQQLDKALTEASQLIRHAGYKSGQIIVLTGETPSSDAIHVAKKLAAQGITTSIMPVVANQTLNPLFQALAEAGHGQLIPYRDTSDNLEGWLNIAQNEQFQRNKANDIPLWRDEGRWFLLPSLLFLLPVFRRGWLQRINT